MTTGSMDYERYEPTRYAPDETRAIRQGLKDLRALRVDIGPDRQQRILEVGCGGGSLLTAMKSEGYEHCKGVDVDERLVKHCRELLALDVVRAEWRPFLAESAERFDRVIALDVLEHLHRDELADTLRETRRRIAKGGKLILRSPNPLCPFVLPILYGDITHQFIPTPRLLVHLLREAGFSGDVAVRETRPSGGWKRYVFAATHALVVRPALRLTHFYFHGELPEAVTPNFIVVANAS